MNVLRFVAYILTIIGALNWGLIGIFGFNLVAAMFGDMTVLARIIYGLVGVSAVVTVLTMRQCEPIKAYQTCRSGSCNL